MVFMHILIPTSYKCIYKIFTIYFTSIRQEPESTRLGYSKSVIESFKSFMQTFSRAMDKKTFYFYMRMVVGPVSIMSSP